MKKLIFTLILAVGFLYSVDAQGLRIDPHVVYNTEAAGDGGLGVGAGVQYMFTSSWGGYGSFNYYFLDDDEFGELTFYAFNINANYYFTDSDAMGIYALAGLNIGVINYDVDIPGFDDSVSESGLQLGAGIDLPLGNSLLFNGQAKYILSDFDGLELQAGLRFNL